MVIVGHLLHPEVGLGVGLCVGYFVGVRVGFRVGCFVGLIVGDAVLYAYRSMRRTSFRRSPAHEVCAHPLDHEAS